ncbi:MAG: hypothetical protein ABJN57_01650 [Hyphomicrobiales bacterium]
MQLLRLFAVLFFMTIGLSGCSDTYEWNEKVTVEVETPDGLKTASSVQAVELIHTWAGLPEMKGASASLKGEAVVLEVLPGRYLFALLSSERDRSRRLNLFYNSELDDLYRRELGLKAGEYKNRTVPEKVALTLRTKGRSMAMPSYYYPILATFKDINDPSSVQKVEPDNLSVVFGSGVKLKRITYEIVDEPVTRGKIEAVLKWFDSVTRLIPKDQVLDYYNRKEPVISKGHFISYRKWGKK